MGFKVKHQFVLEIFSSVSSRSQKQLYKKQHNIHPEPRLLNKVCSDHQ